MNPRDRLIAVLEKREADCIPIVIPSMVSKKSEEIMKLLGGDSGSGPTTAAGGLSYQDTKRLFGTIKKENPSNWREKLTEIANFVAKIPVNPKPYVSLRVDGYHHQPTLGNVTMLDENRVVTEWGSIYSLGEACGELTLWYTDGLLETPEQRNEWTLPVPEADRVRDYQKALKMHGEKTYPVGFVPGIFELTWQCMGFIEFSRYLRTNPAFIRKVFGEHANFIEELFKLLIDAGAEVLGMGDDIAYKQNLMISPKTWVEFVQPMASRIISTVHKRGGLIYLHSDGYVTPLMDLLIEAGYDGVQSLEPLAGVNLAEVKEKYGGKIGLIGGIDGSQLLPYGSKRAVENAVKDAIKVAGRGGGYAIGPSTEIHWKCKPENVLAMIKCARKYGKYPL